MNITKIKLTVLSICGLMLTPVMSYASTALVVNDTTALFTIDFSFTDELFTVDVPIAAEFGVTYLDRVDTVGYTIESDTTPEPDIVSIQGIVLSSADIVDDRYEITSGTTGTFTLLVIATFAEPISEAYQARITKLPYWLDDRRTTVHQNQLDELQQPALGLE